VHLLGCKRALRDAPGRHHGRSTSCRRRPTAARLRLVYIAFDLLHLDSEDLVPKPLLERKARLASVMKGASAAACNTARVSGGAAFLEQAFRLKSEGIVSKRVDAPYATERSQRRLADGEVYQPPRIRRRRLDPFGGHPAGLGAS
jgi:hypothetical protein